MTAVQYFHIAFESWAALICAAAAVCIFIARSFEPKASWTAIGMLITDAMLNIADIMTYYEQGRETYAAGVILRISYFLVFFCGFILSGFAAAHIERVVVVRGGHKDAYLSRATYLICLTGIITLIFFRFSGLGYGFNEHNLYCRKEYFSVLLMLEALPFLPILARVLKNRKVFRRAEYHAFLCFGTLPVIGIIAQYFYDKVSLFNAANSIALIIIIVTHLMVYSSDNVIRERRRINERIRLYHSQIRPHFIYNTLTAIRASLDEPAKAENLLNHFAEFLRGSMDVLMETECIPAQREFETVEDYLFVEKARFGDSLTVDYDVKDTDYLMPAFTVQTIAENAVRHGVRCNPDGRGTVNIRSYEAKASHIIEIKDDGVGFDPKILESIQQEDPASAVNPLVDPDDYLYGIRTDAKNLPDEDLPHVGLSNVKKRLALMCGGTMDIDSEQGKGTLVRISIPKQQRRSNS